MVSSLVLLLGQVAIGIYLLIAAISLFTLWRWSHWHRIYRSSRYDLEKDLARYRRANSLTLLVILFQLALILYGIQSIVIPDIRTNRSVQQTFVDGLFVTPIPAPPTNELPFETSISEVDLTPFSVQNQIFVTPVPTPTPVGTILPGAPPASGCTSPDAMLQIPANGQRITGTLTVYGTAFAENFNQYVFELKGPGTLENFVVLTRYINEVRDHGQLGQFVPAQFDPGSYRFRLIVFDTANEITGACEVTIYIAKDPAVNTNN